MDNKREKLTKAMRWEIADMLAEERLPAINARFAPVSFTESFYTKYGKRLIDIVLSLIAVVISLPVNIIIGIITVFDVGFPIFFTQERIGKNGKTFRIIKFRNMKDTHDEHGELLPPDKRVTKWGKIVRKTSLDELLNFYSVLKGDMSIIGPRPLVPQYMSRYSDRHLARYYVKPGLECPPRAFDKPLRTWNDQFENDVWYVQNVSFKTDLIQVVNLIRFTFDRKNTTVRANAIRGDFMGYDIQGKAINLAEVPDTYIDMVIKRHQEEEI